MALQTRTDSKGYFSRNETQETPMWFCRLDTGKTLYQLPVAGRKTGVIIQYNRFAFPDGLN
jgi:hypothetical protein